MKKGNLGLLAVSLMSLLATQESAAMDVATVKSNDGKFFFCANAKCAGNSITYPSWLDPKGDELEAYP